MPTFYEFFAGGGMVRAGLGRNWRCLFANDVDLKKGATYTANWGVKHLHIGDVAKLGIGNLPAQADLAWASFPCQDLSLAGAGAGLEGDRSGTFWPFWDLMRQLGKEGRAPRMVVLENVCGALTSHGGKDFAAISSALTGSGYRFGAVIIDAVNFLPHSRPRLFIIGVAPENPIPKELTSEGPTQPWHTDGLMQAYGALSGRAKAKWIWWQFPQPLPRSQNFVDIIEDKPKGVKWHTAAETKQLLAMMSAVNIAKVKKAQQNGGRVIGAVYKRTRTNDAGEKVQRAEVRFDDVAGCLRTPAGGSSRQSILVIEGKKVRSRLLSPREAARLMGLPDDYILPQKYNEAYHIAGDGVAVPVVRFLAANLLERLLLVWKEELAAA
ncbi:DNA cytosine methyltransferase [Nitrosovibrio sp. Nv4]|uniref:DNA cytosine methyltransferase n=1 Tax=Nitrosovibrio sp. Nv4 TaxID=1945880 RepID=UPI000BD8A8BB|nr:DNA cytosine methyltransferase [Nitrosovibrio sp. Nv4]SOD42779.1 DNA (cytosine-5)-methyltransferase 1 [Nitrosovibrio sp. Nv4]